MSIVLDGTTGITMPAGGLANTAGATVGTTDLQTLTNKTIQGGTLISATAVSASGTSVDFTGIPSWVKRITVMFSGVSTNGSSALLIQLGAGSVTTSGYLGASGGSLNGSTPAVINATTGFPIFTNGATSILHGNMTITLLTSNSWSSTHAVARSDSAIFLCGGGSITLAGTLDRLRITTVNGTDTFDAGTINIMYE